MDDVYEKALELHKKYGGKLGIKSRVRLKSIEDLSLAYTPGVAGVSRAISKNPNTAYDYTIKKNSIAVISDGSAILGLGNLGALAAIPVMEGKAVLFKELADIDAFPICLETQGVEEIIKTVKNISPVFGGINLEDISAPRCFEILERLKNELDIPVVHDDQSGSAVVVLAATINALKLRGSGKDDTKIVINGAGAAGTAVAKLLINYDFKNVTVCDSKGVISEKRGNLTGHKLELARLTKKPAGNLDSALKGADIFIGLSKGGMLNAEMIKTMNEKAIVFALANPVPEIMPDEAKKAEAWIVATGRSDFPNQINNVLGFPGIFRGALDNRVKTITDSMLIRAAENLAAHVKNLSSKNLLPNILDKTAVQAVAKAITD